MKYIFLLFLLCAEITYGQSDKNSENWKTYKKGHYSVEYPSSWRLDTGGQFGTEFYLYSEKEDEDDQFLENISLILQDMSKTSFTLKELADLTEQQIMKMITNYQNVESKEVKIGAQTFYHLAYTGEQGIYQLYFDQYFMLSKETVYVFTYTSGQDTHDDYEAVFLQLIQSFKVK